MDVVGPAQACRSDDLRALNYAANTIANRAESAIPSDGQDRGGDLP